MTLHPYERGIRNGSLGHGNPAQYDYVHIKSFFANVKPADLDGLQLAYTKVQTALSDLERRLGQHVKRLNQIWGGDAQQAGTGEVKRLSENAGTLAKASGQFGTAMASGGSALRAIPPLRDPVAQTPTGPAKLMPGLIAELGASPADTEAARQALARLNSNLASAFDQIPASLTLDLPTGNYGETPYLSGGAGQGTPGAALAGGGALRDGVSGTGGTTSPHTGIPLLGKPGSDPGGGTSTPHSPYGSANPPGPTTIRIPTGEPVALSPAPSPGAAVPGASPVHNPSDLEGSDPNFSQPVGGPGSPSPTAPFNDAPNPGLGRTSPGGGMPLPPTGGGSPPVSIPGRQVGGLPRLPQLTDPEPYVGGILGPNRLTPRGVLGGPGPRDWGGMGEEPLGPYGTAGEPRSAPPGGVLRNGVLRPGADAAGMPMAEARPGVTGTGFPMTGAMGGGGGNSERSREVSLVEDDDLWRDETAVSPRVIGGSDQPTGDQRHGS